MAQFVYTMNRVSKVVPPKREILKDISLSFFPGAKIGVLGLNGSGKSTLLKIMAGVDTEIDGEARPQPGINVGYLPQEPQLDPNQSVRDVVEEGVGAIKQLLSRFDEISAAFAEPMSDDEMNELLMEQGELQNQIDAVNGWELDRVLEQAADALRLPPWDSKIEHLSGVKDAVSRSVGCFYRSRTCCCLTSRPTTWTQNLWRGLNTFWSTLTGPWSPLRTIAISWTTPPVGF